MLYRETLGDESTTKNTKNALVEKIFYFQIMQQLYAMSYTYFHPSWQ